MFCFAVISLATVVVAQDKPLADVTGAYQFNHLTASADGEDVSANVPAGFDARVNVPITRWFGAVGDIGRTWKNESASVGNVQASATSSIRTYGVLEHSARTALTAVASNAGGPTVEAAPNLLGSDHNYGYHAVIAWLDPRSFLVTFYWHSAWCGGWRDCGELFRAVYARIRCQRVLVMDILHGGAS